MPREEDELKGYAWIIFAFFLGIAICILATKV
jgi:hypothetical protein